jgi:polar amino acid transport system permease protein
MAYGFDFAAIWPHRDVLVDGVLLTLELTAIGTVAGVALGTLGAAARTSGNRLLKGIIGAYVELIRNTPFLVQLFFVFFGLPALGLQLTEFQAACIAMVVNLGAYSTEIIRAGIEAIPRGQIEAGRSLAMSGPQIFRYIILKPALQKVWPALSSQVIIVMLGSAVCSQIAVEELSYAASYIQSRNFRALEVYLVTTLIYILLAVALRAVLRGGGSLVFARPGRA